MDGSIFIDYRDTLRKADELDNLARQIENRVLDYMGRSGSIAQAAWTGTTAEIYKRKNMQIMDKLSGHARELRSTAEGIRKAANYYKWLEEQANAIFRR